MVQKTVLITGSSEGGIGDALAKEFHRKGLRVFATARNLAKVEHLKNMGIEVLKLDVVDDVSIKEAVEDVKSRTNGTLDILVNNSGGGYSIPLLDSTAEAARKLFDLNVFALIAVTQAFAPLLIASKGTVINIGSIAGIAPMPWEGYYHATKAAVGILSDTLRMEMSPFDVKVINVVTGGVKTKFFANIPNQKLPPNSLYAAAREDIEPIMNGAIIADSGWDADTYAKDVVSNALKSSPKLHVWKGSGAWAVWFVDTFGWATIWDLVFKNMVKLPSVTQKIRGAQKSK